MYARPETRDQDFDRLIRSSYGLPPAPRRRRPGDAVTMSADTGADCIPQPGVSPVPPDFVEYVVDRAPTPLAEPAPAPAPAPALVSPPLDTTTAPPAPAPTSVAPPAPAAAPTPPVAIAPPGAPVTAAEPMPAPVRAPAQPMPVAPTEQPAAPQPTPAVPPAQPAGQPPTTSVPASLANSPLTSADLAADMQAILSGRPRETAAQAHRAPISVPDPGRPMPDAANEQSIFDRIAQSMAYANSFDLGTVDLERRFDQFERADAARREPGRTRPAAQPVTSAMSDATAEDPGSDDEFWSALPADALSGVPLSGGCSNGAAAMVGPERSIPMYDTGEHVIAGGDLYPDQLVVNGVAFSYGQIMAMGDLYETVEDLRRAPADELTRLKKLIDQDTRHYQGGPGAPEGVSNSDWQKNTNKRYLALADENYSHFSPPSVLGMTDPTSKPDNKSTWERYHEQAIAEMRALAAAQPNSSVVPFGPLTVNAFGDHFLTDAFAAGHLVNKELVLNKLQLAMYQPGSSDLTSAGSAFIERLAKSCWARKPIRDVFSPLEEVQTRAWIHWNIDRENAFRKLLVRIAERAPSKVLNLALKALHDHLNQVGIQVTNDAGDRPWLLKGDGHLATSDTLPIMHRAVEASVANILSPEILLSEQDRGPLSLSRHPALYAKVWRHVPRPTASGRAQVVAAINDYTNLGSSTLLNAAAEVVEKQSPLIAEELRLRKILQDEDAGRERQFWEKHR